jgi:hypothetical protein
VDAWYTIKNMKQAIAALVKMYAINKLKAFINTLDENYEVYEDVESAVRVIKQVINSNS